MAGKAAPIALASSRVREALRLTFQRMSRLCRQEHPVSSLSDFDGGEPVFRFSRAKAIAEGVLVDVSGGYPEQAAAAGIVVPIAMTSAAFEAAICPISEADGDPADLRARELLAAGESFNARAFRVFHTYSHTVARRRSRPLGALLAVAVTVLHIPGHWREIDLWFISSQGDDGEHVLTITLPEEEMPIA